MHQPTQMLSFLSFAFAGLSLYRATEWPGMTGNDLYYLTAAYFLIGTGVVLILYSKLIGVLEEIRGKKIEVAVEDVEEEEA